MQRRFVLAALACCPALPLRAQEDAPRPHYRIPASELQAALAARFPLHIAPAGLFELDIDTPRLLLLPVTQQLGATLQARFRSPQVQRSETGSMDVAFRLRYEASDRTVRAHDLRVLGLRWPGLDADTANLVQALVPELAREAAGEVVLHRFTARELALPETMGFEPDTIAVTDDGLEVTFAPKRMR